MEHCTFTKMTSSLGPLWLCASVKGICGLGFGEYPAHAEVRRMASHGIAAPEPGNSSLLEAAVEQLEEYFAQRLKVFDLPLDLRGTPFQQTVWAALLAIPYGTTATYGEIALRIGRPRATRAVGRANGANPVAIIVPCHRVIGRNGSLVGYAAGVERKAALLQLEQAVLQLNF